MMQTLFICPGNVDHRIKLPLIDLTGNELPHNPAAKGDQNAAGVRRGELFDTDRD
ncbi:hypothetical protein NZA31_002070 [Salmonella enterica]|nr:hypothetical protein [Salmonella enterica]